MPVPIMSPPPGLPPDALVAVPSEKDEEDKEADKAEAKSSGDAEAKEKKTDAAKTEKERADRERMPPPVSIPKRNQQKKAEEDAARSALRMKQQKEDDELALYQYRHAPDRHVLAEWVEAAEARPLRQRWQKTRFTWSNDSSCRSQRVNNFVIMLVNV